MSLKVIQKNKRYPDFEELWDWEIYLEGTPQELKEIEYVEYTLPESFNQPIRRITNNSTGFKLASSCWAEFTIYIRIHYRDSQKEDTDLSESLELEY